MTEDVMVPLTDETFDEFLGATDRFVLVDFWAEWCGPCRAIAPMLESMATEYEGRVHFCKVNIDTNRGLADAFKIRSIPAVVLLQPNAGGPGARVVGHVIGAKGANAYREMISKALAPDEGFFRVLLRGFFGRK
ncbi:MAG: thioredoxin [Myxococcota bacterium]|nr:thioredoxin [Myxococcota bacterium]